MADEEKRKKPGTFTAPKARDVKSVSDAINKAMSAQVSGIMTDSKPGDHVQAFKYSTGILSLDKYLGIGGLLGGRILDIYGWEGTGKTLTALTVAAAMQRAGRKCAFVDAEGTLSRPLAKAIGVNVDDLIVIESTPERILSGEDYFNVIGMLIQSGVEFIIVDSVPAMIPTARMTAVIGQGQKATHASMMAEGLQQMTTLINAGKKSIVWLIDQIRAKPMVMFGPTEDSTGGNALKFYASYRLEVKKVDDIVKNVPTANGRFEDKAIGVSLKIKLHKNKTAVIPLDPISFDVYFETVTDSDGVTYRAGVDIYKDVVEVGVVNGVIKQESSWFSFGPIKTNGTAKFIDELRKSPELMEQIRAKVLGTNAAQTVTVAESAEDEVVPAAD
jgi:recombination protein RecA